jgi:Zn-dependent alcohol dehydrogenase
MKAILRFQLPATLGSDLAGVVLEVGHHVTRLNRAMPSRHRLYWLLASCFS